MRHFPRVFLSLALLLPVSVLAAPIYLNPTNGFASGEHPQAWLAKRTTEVREQKWLRLKLDNKVYGWTSEDTVITRASLTGRAYVLNPVVVFSEPRVKSEALQSVEPGELVSVLGEAADFLKVKTGNGELGFIERSKVVSATELGEKEAMIIRDGTVLKSAPTPDSHEVIRVEKFKRLKLTQFATMKWGKAEVEQNGTVWWPLDDEISFGAMKSNWPKITSSELFQQRKIFDMASNPAVPNLRFASANGIFRTIDDKNWEKIPKFGDQNYPLAVSKSGRLFIGFWYSDDHGETFHSFVRFDQLLSSLKNRWMMNPHRFKFIEVRPVNETGSQLVVKVDIGLKKPVEAITRDQGITWKAL